PELSTGFYSQVNAPIRIRSQSISTGNVSEWLRSVTRMRAHAEIRLLGIQIKSRGFARVGSNPAIVVHKIFIRSSSFCRLSYQGFQAIYMPPSGIFVIFSTHNTFSIVWGKRGWVC
ncbi:uncharacterized protein PgNI_00568, partial [Pyricularia grisea]|uniref:Uncharacterized protein n=1 Tax=Pyricularia grisea TaxID=148305 RepID=A0A6P8BHZ5_PYRGI